MKRGNVVGLLLVFILLLTGCSTHNDEHSSTGTTGVYSGKENSIAGRQSPEGNKNLTDPNEIPLAYNEDVEKYYDYFIENNHIGMLLGNETGNQGFSDSEMAAFALSELILKSNGNYTQEIGFPKEDIDAVTQQYFGTTIQTYETQKSTVVSDTGNITSTGWGGNLLAFVLKELKTEPDEICTGVFYQFNFGMDGIESSAKADLLRGIFDNYGQPFLVTIVFEEKTDKNGAPYLRYYEVKTEGVAKPPYVPYQG